MTACVAVSDRYASILSPTSSSSPTLHHHHSLHLHLPPADLIRERHLDHDSTVLRRLMYPASCCSSGTTGARLRSGVLGPNSPGMSLAAFRVSIVAAARLMHIGSIDSNRCMPRSASYHHHALFRMAMTRHCHSVFSRRAKSTVLVLFIVIAHSTTRVQSGHGRYGRLDKSNLWR
jgi:hypothetical protein